MVSKKLNKTDITKLGIRSMFASASFNFERMQGCGWCCSMQPTLKKIYQDDKNGLALAMRDQLDFINTNPNMAGFLMGLLISLEENGEKRDTIKSLRVALFGPLAGIGDAIFWFTLLPIMAGLSASFAMNGSILGPIMFFMVYVGVWLARIPLTHLGYKLGVSGIEKIKNHSTNLSKAATILGVTVIGGLVASYVKINILTTISLNETSTLSIQKDFLDKVIPNLLPLVYTFTMYYFLRFKQAHPVVLIATTFLGAIVLSFFTIL